MIRAEHKNTTFSLRGVGVVIHNGKLLVQKRKDDKFWALPGGSVEMGEKSELTPVRELEEEIGVKGFNVLRLLYVCESFFSFKEHKNHQIAFYYLLDCPKNFKYINKYNFDGIEEGKNIVYTWLDLDNLENEAIKPEFLKKELKNIVPYPKHIVEEE